MATLLFTALGTLVGGPIGGVIGAIAGRQVDSLVFRPGSRQGPRLTELGVTTSSYGIAVPRQFGRMRVAGQIIWATDLVEHREKQGGGKGKPSTTTYNYTVSFAVALSSRSVQSIDRVWADGKLLRGADGALKTGGTMRLHRGAGDQTPDPLISAVEGVDRCPAWRGVSYVVFEDLQLADYGNRIPALTFEVTADTAELSVADLTRGIVENVDANVPLPGIAGLSADGSLADLLGAFDPLFPLDFDACDEQLALRPERLQSAAIPLPDAATSAAQEDFGGNAGFARKRAPTDEQPLGILRYYDVARDYQPGAQRASGRPFSGQPQSLELPAAMSAVTARQLIESSAHRQNWGRQTLAWRVTQIDPAVRPGTVVTVPGHPGKWKVREWEWREHGVDLALSRHSPGIDLVLEADAGRGSLAPDLAPGATHLIACELPWDGNPGSPVPVLLAATSSANPAWGGASLYVDQGDGALQPLGTSGRGRAILGTATSLLAPASTLLFDRLHAVDVDLAGLDLALTNATQRQLALGANRALLGQEIVQFAAAEPLGAGRWRLSGLWRGRGGTEAAVYAHVPGEPFLLLDGSGTLLDPARIGTVPGSLIAAIGLGDAAAVTSPIQLFGIGTRPLSPVHGVASLLPDGDLLINWVRRARGAWAWDDGGEIPLGEQSEAYTVTFGPPSAPIARWDVKVPELAISAATLAGLTANAPTGPIAIRQVGDHAQSNPLIVPVP